MNVPTVHCHTCNDKSTSSYVRFMWETMRSLANHPEDLKLSVHCISPTAADRLGNLVAARSYVVPNAGSTGSSAHGACIEHALRMVDDGDIHLLVDSDTVMLARGWDDHVRRELLDDRVGTIGTTYEDIGGFSSGAGTLQTYKGIPNVVWMALSPLHQWRDLRAAPQKTNNVRVRDEEQSKTYGLPVGHTVLCDVGWQIPEYIASRGITYVGWKQLKPQGDATVLKGLSDYHEEYHVLGEGGIDVPFVAHHRGSLRHAYRGDNMSQRFYEVIDAWLEKERAREPHWRWRPGPQNNADLAAMAMTKQFAAPRLADFEAEHTQPVPGDATGSKAMDSAATLEGWLKATLDGKITWSRHTLPAPAALEVDSVTGLRTKHLRLEGTVNGLHVLLPASPDVPCYVSVRNVTAGPVTVRVTDCKRSVEVPTNKCLLIVVDVDGAVQVG